jgi:ferric-dicitrate binding protein FerR (iron transport regulator)
MNQKHFEVFARWVRQQNKNLNDEAAYSARLLGEDLESLAKQAETGAPARRGTRSTSWPRAIAELEAAAIMAEIFWWVEKIENDEEDS